MDRPSEFRDDMMDTKAERINGKQIETPDHSIDVHSRRKGFTLCGGWKKTRLHFVIQWRMNGAT